MSQRENDSVGQFSVGAALGALIGGVAAFVAGLRFWKFRNTSASEDSPIIIKGGSLSVALLDDTGWTFGKERSWYSVSNPKIENKSWRVRLAVLESGCPVGDPGLFDGVSKLQLELTSDNGAPVDTITVTYAAKEGTLKFEADTDDDFGTNVVLRHKNPHKSKRHKVCAFHNTVAGAVDFQISKVTCTGHDPFPPSKMKATNCVLAFEFV